MSHKFTIAEVQSIQPLTASIFKILLKPDPYVSYQAGQYLQLTLDGQVYSYSIANAPRDSNLYELHVRYIRDNAYHVALLDTMNNNNKLNLALPFGFCHVNTLITDKPIIFIASGTGFAPIKAMIENMLITGDGREFELYRSIRSQDDLYMQDKISKWQHDIKQFHYFPDLSTALSITDKAASLVGQICKHHADDLDVWQIVIGGPFDFVYSARDMLHNLGAKNLFSDAFEFE